MSDTEVSESEDTVTSQPIAANPAPASAPVTPPVDEPIKFLPVADDEPIKRKPGRPKGSKNAQPEPQGQLPINVTAKPVADAQKPSAEPQKPPTKSSKQGNSLDEKGEGYLSSREHKQRCQRMMLGAQAALPLGLLASDFTTSVMNELIVARHMRARLGKEKTDEFLDSLPHKSKVRISVPTNDGKVIESSVAELEAQGYAALIAYAVPIDLSDPLIGSIAGILHANAMYAKALHDATDAFLKKQSGNGNG